MKLRHAATLALTGWYLMVPTSYGDHSLRYERELPLSRWTAFESFNSADDCEITMAGAIRNTAKDRIEHQDDPNNGTPAQRLAFLYTQAQCIETDDPRLRGEMTDPPYLFQFEIEERLD